MTKTIKSMAVLWAFAALLVLGGCGSAVLNTAGSPAQLEEEGLTRAVSLPAAVDDGVILHAYNWRFSDIQNALPQIAAAGYKAVQTSPVQGTKATGQWWLLYQPTNFAIGNAQLGTKTQFESLCAAANNYGIKIIIDAVLNHVADNGSDGQWANEVESYLKRSDWYHNKGTISDYKNRGILTQGNLGSLPDLATQRADVQQVILGFLNTAVASGAGGFRFDAAKHIETNQGLDAGQAWAGNFWDVILGGLSNRSNLYLYGEVIQDTGDNLSAYTSYYDVTAHGYIWTLSSAVDSGSWGNIQSVNGVPADKALVYMENHDTYEHGETSSFSFWKRKAMWAVITARASMTPLFLDRPGVEEWNEGDIAALNNFRNAMVGQGEVLRYPASKVLMIERGTKGAVLINAGPAVSVNSTTALTAGSYPNKGLSSTTLSVAGGMLSGSLPAYSVVIIYNGSTPVPPATPTGLTAAVSGSNQINLSWNASSGATGYTVYRSATSGGTYASVGSVSATTFANSGLIASTTYYYKVQATNSAGSSAQSAYVSATTAAEGSGLKLHFKKNAVANWSSVNTYYWAANGSPVSNTWPGQAMTAEGNDWYVFTIPGASSANVIFNNGSTQTVDLNRTGEGWFVPGGSSSGKITGTWYSSNPESTTAPAVPTGVSASAVSASQINISWTASSGAASYNVLRSASSAGTYSVIATVTGTTYSNTGLAAATTYYYRVTATNSVGTSAQSVTVSATTTSSGSSTTTIRVHYDVGMGNTMTVRGSLAPLSWTAGTATVWTTGNVWVYTTTAIASGAAFEFKTLINDNRWSDGANFAGSGGTIIDVYPTYNGNFYDVMDTISTNWAISGGTTTYKWYQGTGVAQARATSAISYLTQKTAMNKQGTAVTLAFKYKTVGLDSGEYLKVQVLKGTVWTTVGTYTGTKDWTNVSINITSYQSSAMKLRFLSYMNGTDEYVYVDNVTVSVR